MMDKQFLRAYIEITNKCNLTCSFCAGTSRKKKFIELDKFTNIASQVQPIARQVYLHVMGEPLLHPQLELVINKCQEINLPVEIVTNGTQIGKINTSILLNPTVRQINFSFHALQGKQKNNNRFINEIISFTHKAFDLRPDLYINYRFWNLNHASIDSLPHSFDWLVPILDKGFGYQGTVTPAAGHKNIHICNRLYLHFDNQFEWPEINCNIRPNRHGRCLALTQQFAILVDGTVTPCCLDRNGSINLGNCLTEPLENILSNSRATQILEGFRNGHLIEPLCQHCYYCSRFSKN